MIIITPVRIRLRLSEPRAGLLERLVCSSSTHLTVSALGGGAKAVLCDCVVYLLCDVHFVIVYVILML